MKLHYTVQNKGFRLLYRYFKLRSIGLMAMYSCISDDNKKTFATKQCIKALSVQFSRVTTSEAMTYGGTYVCILLLLLLLLLIVYYYQTNELRCTVY